MIDTTTIATAAAATPKEGEKVDAEINRDPVEDEAENLVIELRTSRPHKK